MMQTLVFRYWKGEKHVLRQKFPVFVELQIVCTLHRLIIVNSTEGATQRM